MLGTRTGSCLSFLGTQKQTCDQAEQECWEEQRELLSPGAPARPGQRDSEREWDLGACVLSVSTVCVTAVPERAGKNATQQSTLNC